MRRQTKPASNFRVRRGLLVFALCALLVVFMSGHIETTPAPPSIDISAVKYEPIEPLFNNNSWRATYALTNTGSSTFVIEISMADYVRIETDKGWITETNWIYKHGRSVIRFDWTPTMRPGEGAESKVELPANTRRWQAGYEVTVLSAQKNLESKLGPKISKPILTWFGDWIPDQEKTTIVWGPVITMKTNRDALLHHAR